MQNVDRFLLGSVRNIFQYICYKRSIALIPLIPYGLQNGATKLFLAITRAMKQGYVYFLVTTLISKLKRSLVTPKDDLSSATLKPMIQFNLGQCIRSL